MKKLFSFLIIAGLFLLGSNAYADSSSTANALSSAGATAMNGIGTGGSAGASITLDQQFYSKGSDIPMTPPGIPGVAVPTPQLFSFGQLSNPTNINGIAPSLYFEKKCAPEYTRGDDSSTVVYSGKSGKTDVVFTSYPNYKKQGDKAATLERVLPRFPEADGSYVCLAVVMTTAEKGSEGKVNLSVILDDTVKFAFDKLEGYTEIYLVSPEQSIGTALGVNTDGSGYNLGSGLAGLTSGNPATAVAIGAIAAFSKSNASTHPDGRLGRTYWVLGKPKDPASGIRFNENEYNAFMQNMARSPNLAANGNNGPKLEATK